MIETQVNQPYKYGWVTDIDADTIPQGLNEDIVRMISEKKQEPEFMLEWRLKAYRHWLEMVEPTWPNVTYPPIDYQAITYYSAPKSKKKLNSLDEVDPEVLRTFEKLGIPLLEQKMLSGVAVDAVFDSVSVATTFKDTLAECGVIFCPFSEAVPVLRGGARPSRADREVSRIGCAIQRQLFRRAQFRGLLGRLVLLHTEGRALSDGAVYLFSHEFGWNWAIRADADHCGRGCLRELSGRLLGPDA